MVFDIEIHFFLLQTSPENDKINNPENNGNKLKYIEGGGGGQATLLARQLIIEPLGAAETVSPVVMR